MAAARAAFEEVDSHLRGNDRGVADPLHVDNGRAQAGAEQKEEKHPKTPKEAIEWSFRLFDSQRQQAQALQEIKRPLANLARDNPNSRLLTSPRDVVQKVLLNSGLAARDHEVLARTGKNFHAIFKLSFSRMHLQQLLQHVVYGNQAEVEKIIRSYPGLLLQCETVTDYSGRTLEGTALQLALGAEDVAYFDDEECMVEMIQRYLLLLKDGEEEIKKQYDAQFPVGWFQQEIQRAEKDLAALNKIFKAIAEAKPQNDSYEACAQICEPALSEFRQYLASQAKAQVIKTGKHFNAYLLVEALKLYKQNYQRFGNESDSPKNMLSWQKVIGFIQRYLPACYAQVFCQGLFNRVTECKPLQRSLKFRYDPQHFFFPLALGSSGLGYDYAALMGGISAGLDVSGSEYSASYMAYVNGKQRHYKFYMLEGQAPAKLCVVQ